MKFKKVTFKLSNVLDLFITQDSTLAQTWYTDGCLAVNLSAIPYKALLKMTLFNMLKEKAESAGEDHHYRNGDVSTPFSATRVSTLGEVVTKPGEEDWRELAPTLDGRFNASTGDFHLRKFTAPSGEESAYLQDKYLRVVACIFGDNADNYIFAQKLGTDASVAPVTILRGEDKKPIALIMPVQVK